MKFKKSLIVVCIIICLFSITSVSASEVNDTITTIGNNDDGIIASSQEDVLGNANTGTFTDLQNQINAAAKGSTINLDKDYVYDEGFSTKGILINKDLTINGNGHTLNGLSKSRILIVQFGLIKNNQVTLNNIKFANGYTDLYGGAIFNYGNLTVNHCTFANNHAECCGGAINSVGYLNSKNSIFTKNYANGDGGAILCLSFEASAEFFSNYYNGKPIDGNMEFTLPISANITLNYLNEYVTNCTFRNNIANGTGGGAIYALGHITIDSSIFSTNTAGKNGGAAYACKDLFIKNSKFYNNVASKYGGAVYLKCYQQSAKYVNKTWVYEIKYYKNLIQTSNFTKNVAESGGAIYGFLYNSSDKIHNAKVVKCIFSFNKASTGRDVYGGTTTKCVFNYLKLTLNTVTVKKSAKNLVLTATLKEDSTPLKNKIINFKFNGKTYKSKTNTKGVAKVTIGKSVLKKLQVGKKVAYEARYDNLIVKKTANVKK